MRRELSLREEAERDIDEAWSRYASLSPNLGDALIEELIETLDYVLEFPAIYQVLHRTARRAVLHRFPYSVLYSVHAEAIEVVAVFHSHADLAPILRRAEF